MTKCILSGLDIPDGKGNKEHLVPKGRVFPLINGKSNVFPALKIINSIKGDLLPCEFERLKFEIGNKALNNWNIKQVDRNFIREAMINWSDGYSPNWCDMCIINCKHRQR